jgi:four helix bundle protein
MTMIHNKLEVWKKAIQLVKDVYVLSGNIPDSERFGLISQMRWSAVSIPSNIAEGSARKSDKEFIQFLHLSLGSIAELETQLIICDELDYINELAVIIEKLHSVRQLILGLIKYLNCKK